jgi:RimJ/RimL family protein N-acetyltransferase
MLEGLLVDLVPYGEKFRAKDHAWRNNESRFWSGIGDRRFMSQAQIEAEHREWDDYEGSSSGVAFGVQTKDGQPIGFMGINWLLPHHRLAMLGASIGEPEYWGNGYGTDALLLLVDYAFDELDIRKIWLGTMSLNARVMRQMEKVGFTLEVRQRNGVYADGNWYDELIYGLLREEWPGRPALIAKLELTARR